MNAKTFSERLIAWYNEHHRPLPWRATKEPYKIWLSEIILQQTRVNQGLPYYHAFVDAFPTVDKLAAASEKNVLRLWQGLGYYSRARNLHAGAKHISKKLKGRFPDSYKELLALPGVGPYTAAAIASFSFHEPVAVVDGNVFRVLARIFGLDTDISTSAGKSLFLDKANALLDRNRPALFNQAMMEFGALHCKPVAPDCQHCIFKRSCVARSQGLVDLLPVKSGKAKSRNRHFTYLIFCRDGKLAMKQRNGKDIWKGLFDFPLIELTSKKALQQLQQSAPGLAVDRDNVIFRAKHILTHQIIHAAFALIQVDKSFGVFDGEPLRFFSARQIYRLPKPTLITRFLTENHILE